ncbi:MAG: hypothetical protein H7835_06280 [Magnetococcus sp. XQGC-1]
MRFFSTPESVAQGKPSWLATLETVWATAFCWHLAWYTGSHWPLLLPLWVAPWLLLRSLESTEQGARWFAAYLTNKTRITPFETPIRFWVILLPLIMGVTSVCTSLLADHLLPHHTDWALFIRATLVGVVAMWIAMAIAVAGAMVGSVVIALAVAFSLAMGAARIGVAMVAFSWALAVSMVGLAAGTLALMWMGAVAGEGELTVAILLAGVPWIVGIWLRSIGVRLLATLLHPWRGLCAMPDNWRRILWVVDSHHPPELVPGLAAWTRAFSLTEIRSILRSRGILRKLFGLLAFVCFFLPAIFYRWSLKSTLWFYWPLLYLERVFVGRDPMGAAQWVALLQSGRWERLRLWLSLLTAVTALFLLAEPPSFLPIAPGYRLLDWPVWDLWLGALAAVALSSLAIAGVSRLASPLFGLQLLVWLRNGSALALLAMMGVGVSLWTGG